MENKSGFTLAELLIVVAIIGILFTTVFLNIFKQVERGRDKQKKDHLNSIKIAFEDYYNDKNCYPPSAILNHCDGEELRPYLQNIPCDPKTKQAYILQIDDVNPACPQWFKIYTILGDTNDKAINNLGCSSGCGPSNAHNYCVSSTNVNCGSAPSPSPSSCPASQQQSGWNMGPDGGLTCNYKDAGECKPMACNGSCVGIPEEICDYD